MKTHLMDCDYQKCPRCTKCRIPNAEFEAHKARCSFQCCRQCVRVIRAEEYIQHAKSCSFYRCHRCNTSRIPLPDLKTHFKVCEYRLCEYCHQKTLKDDLGHICFDRSDVSLARTQRKLRENLLNPKINFPKTPSIEKVMILWSKSPYTTAVLDFEYHSECLAEMKEKGVFQLAIANALGEWIVPPTTINHQISTSDLSSKGWKVLEAKYNNLPLDGHTKTQLIKAWRIWQASIVKFYGQSSEDETSGLTWDEIALQLRTYTEKHGKLMTCLEWGISSRDYYCLEVGLQKAKSADLLPPMPLGPERPLIWWATLRKQLQLDAHGLDLSLGPIYRFIFPEDEKTYSRWHDAGYDVLMTIRLVEFYFAKVSGSAVEGKLEWYFPLAQPNLPTAHSLPTAETDDELESDLQDSLPLDIVDEELFLPSEQEILEIEETEVGLIDWESESTTDSEVSRVRDESGDEAEPDAVNSDGVEYDSEYQQ